MTTGRINQVAAASARGVQPGAAPQEPPLSVPTNCGARGGRVSCRPLAGERLRNPPPSPAETRESFSTLSLTSTGRPCRPTCQTGTGVPGFERLGGAGSNVIPESFSLLLASLGRRRHQPGRQGRAGGVRLRNPCEVLPVWFGREAAGRHSLPGEVPSPGRRRPVPA